MKRPAADKTAPKPAIGGPDIHLIADGKRIDPQWIEGDIHRFRIEELLGDLHIGSRSVVPRALGDSTDVRRLGVAVRSLSFTDGDVSTTLRYDSPLLTEGFYRSEDERKLRWTNGNATVPPDAYKAFEGAFELAIEIGGTLNYPEPRGARPAASGLGRLLGVLETANRTRISGWAMDEGNHKRHVGLVVTANGQVIARTLANRFRPDLKEDEIGDGDHAFDVNFPALPSLDEQEIRVTREVDGSTLLNSPKTIPVATSFDSDKAELFANHLAEIDSDAEELIALNFLARQIDLILARRADRDAGHATRLAYRQFHRRWGKVAGGENDDDEPVAAVTAPVERALVIDDDVPVLERDAGSTAIVSHMRALAALGYDVSFVSRAMENTPAMEKLAQAERVTTYGAPFYYSVEDVLKRQADSFSVVYLHRLSNARDYLSLVRTHQPKARVVYSVADLHHLRIARQGEVQQRPELVEHSRRVAFVEIAMARMADAVITHSPVEAQILGNSVLASKIHVIPWAVSPRPSSVPFAERAGLAVIGQFRHPPNPDSVFWLLRHVMPLVWAEDPAIRCAVVGHGWTADHLPQRDDRVDVVGPVENLAKVFDKVRLTVAPLRFGAGVKGKVLDSFAAGIPCVMSPVAAEGLPLTEPLQALVADRAEAMARAILRFHTDAAANEAARAEGLAMIARETSEEQVLKAMAAAVPLAG